MQHDCGLDLTLPIVLHAFLVFYGTARSIRTRSSYEGITDITTAADAINLHLFHDGPPQ